MEDSKKSVSCSTERPVNGLRRSLANVTRERSFRVPYSFDRLREAAAQKEAQKETFIVNFHQHELVPGTNNSGLWNAITARVPFAQWEKMESYSKTEKHHHEGPRRDRCAITPWCWPVEEPWNNPPRTIATEERARDRIYDVQYQLYLGCVDPDEYQEWTVVIYARAETINN